MDIPLTPKSRSPQARSMASLGSSPLLAKASVASNLSASTPSLRIPNHTMSLDISSDSGGPGSGDEFTRRKKNLSISSQKRDKSYYKDQTPFAIRESESAEIQKAHPGKIPVIIERHKSEKVLPVLSKIKFLVPQELTISHLLGILRSRISITSIQSIYLLMGDGKTVCNLSCTIADAYRSYKDADGFLYMKYASQEFYG